MITINDITKKFQEIYYMPDVTPLRMIIASAISPYMEGSPVWLMIVASSGSGKTELLKVLQAIPQCYFISNMTDNTLLSGSRSPRAKGNAESKEVSLLKRMPKRGGMLIWPEFNTLLDERSEKKAAILSQLRSVYDGKLTKQTGLGDDIKWDGRICVIGACTEKYFADMEYLDTAGPRFTIYTLPQLTDQQSKERLMKVKKNEHLFEKTSLELQQMVHEFYVRKVDEGVDAYLDVPNDFDTTINEIAEMVGVASTAVTRNFKGIITDVYGKVDGTRFYRAARKLAQAMMVIEEDKVLREDDAKSIVKMMFDTIPRRRHRVLSIASQYEQVNTKGLAHYLHLPTDTVKEVLQEVNAIGMMTRQSGDATLGDLWSVKPKYRDLFISYEEGTKWKNGNLIHVGEYEDEGSESTSKILPRLSVFQNHDDEEYTREVNEAQSRRAEELFNSFPQADDDREF